MRPQSRKATVYSSYSEQKHLERTEDEYIHLQQRWRQLSETLKAHDEDAIAGCREDLDTLLVFAGLFSAVVTALCIEAYKSLQQDSGDTTASILQHISQQIASQTLGSNSSLSMIQGAYVAPSFQPTSAAIRINVLWFTSLVFSLIAASISMLVKQWLREYLAGKHSTPQEFLRVRQHRYEGLMKWHVFEVVALLPVVLHIALILFFIGLGDFLLHLDTAVGGFVSSLIGLWLCIWTLSVILPAFLPGCPYITPLTKPGIRSIRRSIWNAWSLCYGRFTGAPPRLRKYHSFPGDEVGVRRDTRLDVPALVKIEALFTDDAFLDEVIRPCLHSLNGFDSFQFLRQVLRNRLKSPNMPLALAGSTSPVDFTRLSTRALTVTTVIAYDSLKHALQISASSDAANILQPWAQECVGYIFAAADHCIRVGRNPSPIVFSNVTLLLGSLLSCGRPSIQRTLGFCSRYSALIVYIPVNDLSGGQLSELYKSVKDLLAKQEPELEKSTERLHDSPHDSMPENIHTVDICYVVLYVTYWWTCGRYPVYSDSARQDPDLPLGSFLLLEHRLGTSLQWHYRYDRNTFTQDIIDKARSCYTFLTFLTDLLYGDQGPWSLLKEALLEVVGEEFSQRPHFTAHYMSPPLTAQLPPIVDSPFKNSNGSLPTLGTGQSPLTMPTASIKSSTNVTDGPHEPTMQDTVDMDPTPPVIPSPVRTASEETAVKPAPQSIILLYAINLDDIIGELFPMSELPESLQEEGIEEIRWRAFMLALHDSWELGHRADLGGNIVNEWNERLFVRCGLKLEFMEDWHPLVARPVHVVQRPDETTGLPGETASIVASSYSSVVGPRGLWIIKVRS